MSEPPNINLSCYLNQAAKEMDENYGSDVYAPPKIAGTPSLHAKTPAALGE